ncbi:hypothetical protein FA10DRAFT_42304 [Acaromyces ingoldii]|uniref:Uncharacterized protein n=1 Tax=Acaromyces ingoldii TaxID=215250 RepID=A0A316YZF5_9BASI|nr:hypothetical protein FA10DRAFT_42304 [Acaromyces ingoldii]PWN94154.1 hypothetical protein FA10DRAFT_42304 [Acaromyces ingoldii]
MWKDLISEEDQERTRTAERKGQTLRRRRKMALLSVTRCIVPRFIHFLSMELPLWDSRESHVSTSEE